MEEKDNNITKNDNEMYCTSCGKIIKKEAFVCPHCGVKNKEDTDKKIKWVAAIIALMAGTIGIHKFYLGRVVAGVLRIGIFVACTGVYVIRVHNNFVAAFINANTITEMFSLVSIFGPWIFLVYIPTLLAMIDCIILFTMNDDKFDKKYNKIK